MHLTRLSAFGAHVGISLVIFLIMLYFILVEWYPPPLFSLDGGWQGIRIIAAVDIVLGPMLTLIVFKPGKPGLKFDLFVIACVQSAALLYGAWIVQQERPYAVVFVEDRLYTITGIQLAEVNMEPEELRQFGDDLPVAIYSDLPKDEETLYQLRWKAVGSQRPLYFLREYYRPMGDEFFDSISTNALNMPEYVKDKPIEKKIYDDYVIKQGAEAMEDLLFFPLHSRYGATIVSVNKSDWSLEHSLAIKPPQLRVQGAKEDQENSSDDEDQGLVE